MGKTKNNQELTAGGSSRFSGFSQMRGKVAAPEVQKNIALQRARKKFTAESGTFAELLDDPLWKEVFSTEEEAENFTARLRGTLGPGLTTPQVAELVQALPSRIDYQQIVRKTGQKRLEHFRHILAYPTPGVREFPLDMKKPLVDVFTALITNFEQSDQPAPDIAEEISNQVENLDFEISELQSQDPKAASSLAVEHAGLVRSWYQFLAATDGEYSEYQEAHGPLADLKALEVVFETMFDPGSSREQSEEEVIDGWREHEYQSLMAVLKGD